MLAAIIMKEQTRPSILRVTHQMSRKKRNYPFGSTVRLRDDEL